MSFERDYKIHFGYLPNTIVSIRVMQNIHCTSSISKFQQFSQIQLVALLPAEQAKNLIRPKQQEQPKKSFVSYYEFIQFHKNYRQSR